MFSDSFYSCKISSPMPIKANVIIRFSVNIRVRCPGIISVIRVLMLLYIRILGYKIIIIIGSIGETV